MSLKYLRRLDLYCVLTDDKLLVALNVIETNKQGCVFVTENNRLLVGVLTDGDIRRWLSQNASRSLDTKVTEVMNRSFVSARTFMSPSQILTLLRDPVKCLPVVDKVGILVAIALQAGDNISIGNIEISDSSDVLIVCEIGNNHQGKISLAKKLVDEAFEAGADCVKFQLRDLDSLYSTQSEREMQRMDLATQYTLDLLKKFQLEKDELWEVFQYCNSIGILPICTAWDIPSVRVLMDFGVQAFKVASADLTNHPLLRAIIDCERPIILSTGMSTESEIIETASFMRKSGAEFAMLHCNSTYPTPLKDINLRYIPRLKEIAGTVVGYSGHELGIATCVGAVALGARIVEKHITLDRSYEGADHRASLLPSEFRELVVNIREVDKALGSAAPRVLSQGELINRENLAKSVFVNADLTMGSVITEAHLVIKSPGHGLQPNRIEDIVGIRAKRNLKAGDCIFESDLALSENQRKDFRFNRPYGIPVRYHDFQSLVTTFHNLSLVEFHLSYNDLKVSPGNYIKSLSSLGYAVHCPELFEGDHLLDLASNDPAYRQMSINNLATTIEVTGYLQRYFPEQNKPTLVINAGGWDRGGFKDASERPRLYARVSESLGSLDLSEVTVAIQTMPPFPWHFGGRSYHNIFIDPTEIAHFCETTSSTVCLDLSHAVMACSFYGWDIQAYLETVLPHTSHLHISDAKGVDGEGVQVGAGDVDFQLIRRVLDKHAPGVPFIPEIWQGHKNEGEGFLNALYHLEKAGF